MRTFDGGMMNRVGRILAATLACVTLTAALAGSATRIRVVGNSVFGEREIIRMLGDADAPNVAALQEAYFREGRLSARIDLQTDPSDSTLVVRVVEGETARWGRVSVRGTEARTREDVLAFLEARPDAPFRPRVIDQRVDALLKDYDRAGYPFAQVWVDSLALDETGTRVDAVLYVVEGTPQTLTGVRVEGLAKTREELAVRMTGLEVGTPYTAQLLEDAYLRLTGSRVFDDVHFPELRMTPGGNGVEAVVRVEERRRSHAFSTALGYATDEGSEDGEISGLVQLSLNNIGGTLKDLQVYWSNDGRDRIETRVNYRDRFFLGRQLEMGVKLAQIGLDTLYTWQSVGVDMSRAFGRLAGTLVGMGAGVSGDRNVFSVGELTRSWRLRMSGSVSAFRGRELRNRFLRLSNTVTWARKKLYYRDSDDTEFVAQYIVEIELAAGVSLKDNLHATTSTSFRTLESDEELVPLAEQFYLGGARTLRGYKENQFNGRRVALARSELQLGRTRRENVYLFADTGYILREAARPDGTVDRTDLFRAGYGFGLRTDSRVGNVDLSFGIGEKLSLQQTKVHVVLQQTF